MPSFAADYCECESEAEHEKKQQALDNILYGYNTMGASIALFKDGRIVDTFQYGRANRADNIPVTSETFFRSGSITKMVSAIGVLQLVEKGILDLDTDISTYFDFDIQNPYYPDTPITLRQIMTHTASLKDTYHYEKATNHGENNEITLLNIVFNGNYKDENFHRWEPGTDCEYSNFGGGMLGVFIEEWTGMPVDEYMSHYVFSPAGVTAGYHTPNLPSDAVIARMYNQENYGMTLDPMSFTDTHYYAEPQLDYVHTAGALSITAEGLARLCIALCGDGSVDGVQILKPETVEMMRTLQNNIGSVTCESSRGLNLNILTDVVVKGRTVYGHQGKAYGALSAAYFDPEDQTGVVLLTNGCDDSTLNSVGRIARAVLTKAWSYLD